MKTLSPLRGQVVWILLVLINSSLASVHSRAQAPASGSVPQAKQTNEQPGATLPRANEGTVAASSKTEDIRKLLKLTMHNGIAQQVSKQMIPQLKAIAPNVSSELWNRIEGAINPGELADLCVPIYAKHLTHDQIKGLIQFYESPLGKSYLEATPRITEESLAVFNEWGKRLGEGIVKEMNETKNNPLSKNASPDGKLLIENSKKPLFDSEEQKRAFIRFKGLDPEKYDLDEVGLSFVPRSQAGPPDTAIQLPPSVRYFVKTADRFYYSEKEPKPTGNGFKFTSWPEKLEITVVGNVVITKVGND